jgi:hypothetical protein
VVEKEIGDRSKAFVGIGLILLIFGAAFITAPFYSKLAIQVYLIGIVICMIFLLSLHDNSLSRKRTWFGFLLIGLGTIGFALTLGCVSVQCIEYRSLNLNRWINIFSTLIAAIITTSITTVGISLRTGWRGKRMRWVWVKIFILMPIVIVLIAWLNFVGFAFST